MRPALLLVCLAVATALPVLKSPRAWVQINLASSPNEPIIIELDGDDAPMTSANFLKLVQNHMYDDTVFHRVVPDFVVQGGDPTVTHSPANAHAKDAAPIPLEIRALGQESIHYKSPPPSGPEAHAQARARQRPHGPHGR